MRIRPIYFLVIYIASIFLFAFIYSLMPYAFYHTTVKYEKTINEGTKELEPDLLSEIKDNLRTFPNSDTVIINGANFSVKNIAISNLTVNDFAASFSMSMTNISTKNGSTLSLSKYHINFDEYDSYEEGHTEPHTVYIYEDEPFPYWYGGRIGFLFKKNNLPITFYPDPKDTNYNVKPKVDKGYLLFSDKLVFKLCAYSNAQNGFPASTKGNFSRMFYLSAITITTVGYGDILPITPLARTLLSLEAIWGIIIIGLFLNSLANRIKSKS